MRHTLRFCFLALVVSLLWTSESSAALRSRRIATGLNSPIYATAAPGDSSRLFIAERNGVVKIFDRNTQKVLDTPFIDFSSKVSTLDAGGLLGMAFDPNYDTNGRYIVYYTNLDHNSQISSFNVSSDDPNISLPSSGAYVMRWDRVKATHTGGWIGFSPIDHDLYILSGDGGGHFDPYNNAQDASNVLGSVIRIDPNGDAFPNDMFNNYTIPADNPFVGTSAAPENWAIGLRNPWRGSFDKATGDLIFGDVGQDTREEINFQRADSTGGANYGWPLREGTIATPNGGVGGDPPPGNVDPAYDYAHGDATFEGHAVTGGYVYRGPDPEMQGKYFFSDFENGTIWSIEIDRNTGKFVDGTLKDWTNLLAPDQGGYQLTASMAEDADGNLYVINITGDMFMLESIPEVAATGAYLNALYSDVLGRKAENGGLGYWGSEITAGNITYDDVATTFLNSPEHLNNEINGFYNRFLGRNADAGGMSYWSNNITTTPEADVVAAFLTSAEFTASHASDGSFVDALYQLVLGRDADANGRTFYMDELSNGTTRADLALQFATSAERYRMMVEGLYQDYLGRDGDQAGVDYYVSQLLNNSTTLEDLAKQFLTSDEYVYGSHRAIGDFDTYIASLPFGAAPTTAVPEPSAALLALAGFGLLAVRRRQR